MTWLTLSEIAELAGGRLHGRDAPIDSVTTDTRKLSPGQLFVALTGPRFDGHDYVAAAGEGQATGVLVSRRLASDLPQIVVDDTLAALTRLATAWRRRVDLPVVALTGSNGKTTVKETIAAALRGSGAVHATAGNLNNHIGVPLSVLGLRAGHDFAVIEMGANHAGEIAALSAIARPSVGVVTNAAAAHLEGFGSLEGVARAKGELFEGLGAEGIAIVNADDAYAAYWLGLAGARKTLTFGLQGDADVRAALREDRCPRIVTPAGSFDVDLALTAPHHLLNAAAATAAAVALEVPLATIKAGLESVDPVGGRLVIRPARGGAEIIDDSYNANPASLAAAIGVLVTRARRAWLVLGDMAELGSEAESLHREAGRAARAQGVERLYALGPLSAAAVSGFGAGAQHFDDRDALIEAVTKELGSDVSVLVKGSRSMRMERVVAGLLAAGASDAGARQGRSACC